MVKFYVGKANIDISGRIRREIAELSRDEKDGQRIILIVPEQFEYETERAVYRLFKKEGLLQKMSGIEITTFTALSSEILSENGENRPRADDIVKSVLMHKAVAECRGELTALAGIADKAGFCDKLTATVTGFKSLGLSSRDLGLSVENHRNDPEMRENAALLKKLDDVSLLYTSYDTLMEKKGYLDNSDVIGYAAELVKKSAKFQNADVFVDSFNDFTNHQLRFLSELLPLAKSVSIGFTTDCDDEENDVFKTANSHIKKLLEKAENEGISAEKITSEKDLRYSENLALSELSQRLFQGVESGRNIGSECDMIRASDIYEESDFVCSKIKQLVEDKKSDIRYRDIAVLCTDLGTYGRYIESAFAKYEIPIFLDMHESILSQPLVNAVVTLINALRDFSADAVLSCIKTGFFTKYDEEKKDRVGLSDYDIGVFEDYMFEWALGTEHLKNPFTFKSSRLSDDDTDYRMLAAENIRRTVAVPLLEFSKKLKQSKSGTDGSKLTEMIYDYLIDTVHIKKALFAKCVDPTDKEINGDRSALYQRLWDTLMKIFDTLHDELKGYKISIDEYYRLFRDVCSGTTLASPPQMVDRVLVGDIDRTRASSIKAAFIFGASFDMFPTPAPQTGIFSQYETDKLCRFVTHTEGGNTAELCLKSAKEQYWLSLYRAYKAVCLPTEYLCLSYSENSPSGEPMQMSSVFEEIRKIFPKLEIRKASEFGDDFYCRSINAAKLRFALSINSSSRENALLNKALCKSECSEFVKRLEELKRELKNEDPDTVSGEHKLSPGTASLLFPTQVGATDIEKMARCRFSFFCEKGLGITQRTQRNFNSFKRGDAVHFVLEKILQLFSTDIDKFCRLTRRELFGLSRKFLGDYISLETNNSFLEDARSQFLFNNLANSAADVLITMQTEFCSRRYRPKFFELDLRGTDPINVIDNESPINTIPPEAALFFEEEPVQNADIEKLILTENTAAPTNITINTAPLSIPLDNGRTLTVSGRIDRVDMFSENGKLYVRAVDYKSSVRAFDINNARSGINIQMLLYLSALLDANRGNTSANLTAGGISYIPSHSSGAQNINVSPFRLLTMSHRPSGLIILDEATKKEYEDHCGAVINKIIENDNMTGLLNSNTLTSEQQLERTEYLKGIDQIKKLLTPGAQNSLNADEFDTFLGEVKSTVANGYSALLNGDVCALPLEYTENIVKLTTAKLNKKLSCEYCRFADICKNAGKNTVYVPSTSELEKQKADEELEKQNAEKQRAKEERERQKAEKELEKQKAKEEREKKKAEKELEKQRSKTAKSRKKKTDDKNDREVNTNAE